MTSRRSFAALFVFAAASLVNADEPHVDAPVGSIHGRTTTVEGIEIELFQRIPYAEPPVGDLRFALPVPLKLVGELQPSNLTSVCPQPYLSEDFKILIPQTEDCLHLNVYRKAGTKQGDDKPVAAIIHGGAFSVGSAADFFHDSVPLAGLGDVVVVSFNYRLGILGFADMKDLAPGNLGLYDQRLALEWIQDNVRSFGGNPNKVTLLGVSAGSMSVSAHINTPLNRQGRKLFHAAIFDAGVMAPGIVVDSDVTLARVKKIAETLGCKIDGSEMLACLRKADANELAKLSLDVEGYSPIWTFQPTIDGKFIPRDVAEDVRNNAKDFVKVKMLIGTAKDEGRTFSSYRFDLTGTKFPNLTSEKEFIDYCAKLAFGYKYPIDLTSSEVQKRLSEAYYQKNPSRFLDVSDFISGMFVCPTNAFVKSYSKTNHNIYVYRFDRKLHQKYSIIDPEKFGAFHGSPFLHFTGSLLRPSAVIPNITMNAEDKTYILDCIEMVANFMKTDDAPKFRGIEWPDFSKGEGVLVFDEKPHVVKGLFSEDRCKVIFPVFESSP
ncbi:liver carboxylesterase 1-like [Tropilaelaps mercedesae]|uniref:Carboxylic ester hydrolase n=1 Tax=Tropilaelaps mercedesae TaxID=418985 RepID=A0A1V9WZQ9_9ACAR|nr:liver carboxylesterase 1-like [Tropilaelaps mercedesae]